ncbi:Wadjet anti-phage system protein JetD domain-containing protein [Symbiobacterium terraclitae]|uniref:Wadjet anti-phage system protein JetD domain-containing protein n=1 Tax=Symbiobacterium terraclitae TaxID=557451 RepID=UPI0035B525AD
MSRDERMILDLLLDRYERSRHYREPGASRRAVFLRFDRATLPDYWDERRGERRLELNQAVRNLAREGLIELRLSRYSREEVERVDLVLERLDEAYRRAGRTPRRAREAQLAAVAEAWAERWAESGDWRHTFAARVAGAVHAGEPLPARLTPDDGPLLGELCRVLDKLGPAGLADEEPRRLFSQRVLGNSKRLEAIQGRLLRVLREFCPEPLPEDDREALAELGIVENPQHVLVAGPLVIGGLDIGSTGSDVGLSAPFVKRCTVTAVEADRVITVENLTSFHQLVSVLPPRTVAVYLGGYPGPLRRRFLEKLSAVRPLAFSHWGDIDLGGFRIFVHLRGHTGLPIAPLLMDVETYRQYRSAGMPFDERYGRRLAALLDQPAYAPFWPVIRAMLADGLRVEQEAIPAEMVGGP